MQVINAQGLYYKELNQKIKELIKEKEYEITLQNVNGQRYIGDGLSDPVKIYIEGVPGNDLAAFAGGVEISVNNNVQDGIGNTMDKGKIIVHGNTGDIPGYAMRGGKIYIKGSVGYRAGIHMKGFQDKQPLIIIGGSAGDFFGEYMAGGCMLLLGINKVRDEEIIGNHVAVGMHGGIIYIRDKIEDYKLGREVKSEPVNQEDRMKLRDLLYEYSEVFELDLEEIMDADFTKLSPVSSRPYGKMYSY